MILEIPTDSIVTDFRETASLDGTPYILDFSWSNRSMSWYLDILLQTSSDPVPIVTARRLSVSYPLLTGVLGDSRPLGELFAIDSDGQGDPLRFDLGTRVKLYYFDQAETVKILA